MNDGAPQLRSTNAQSSGRDDSKINPQSDDDYSSSHAKDGASKANADQKQATYSQASSSSESDEEQDGKIPAKPNDKDEPSVNFALSSDDDLTAMRYTSNIAAACAAANEMKFEMDTDAPSPKRQRLSRKEVNETISELTNENNQLRRRNLELEIQVLRLSQTVRESLPQPLISSSTPSRSSLLQSHSQRQQLDTSDHQWLQTSVAAQLLNQQIQQARQQLLSQASASASASPQVLQSLIRLQGERNPPGEQMLPPLFPQSPVAATVAPQPAQPPNSTLASQQLSQLLTSAESSRIPQHRMASQFLASSSPLLEHLQRMQTPQPPQASQPPTLDPMSIFRALQQLREEKEKSSSDHTKKEE